MLLLCAIDEEYRNNLHLVHYSTLDIQNYFDPEGQRKCVSNSYIKSLNNILGIQNKILSDQNEQAESWRGSTDRVALISNTNTIQKNFQKWLVDEATCQFCKTVIKYQRYNYICLIEAIKSLLGSNQTKISVYILKPQMEIIKARISHIKSISKYREYIIVID